jgi:hypothetical protein
MMRRRDFLKAWDTMAVAAGMPYVPAHNLTSTTSALDRRGQT